MVTDDSAMFVACRSHPNQQLRQVGKKRTHKLRFQKKKRKQEAKEKKAQKSSQTPPPHQHNARVTGRNVGEHAHWILHQTVQNDELQTERDGAGGQESGAKKENNQTSETPKIKRENEKSVLGIAFAQCRVRLVQTLVRLLDVLYNKCSSSSNK